MIYFFVIMTAENTHTAGYRVGIKYMRVRFGCLLLAAAFLLSDFAAIPAAFAEKTKSAKSVIDFRRHVSSRFEKTVRASTRYIIVHTSEGGLESTLRSVLHGKCSSTDRTLGGHAHFVIARDGRIFRTLDIRLKANHAGLSMWNGEDDLNESSVGIELVAYHYADITDSQYASLGRLLGQLRKTYRLDDLAVLTHSQVAYGKPNQWFKDNHRGRKRCAQNFERARAGLGPTWDFDPDVRAGRLSPDPQLAALLYPVSSGPVSETPRTAAGSNVITKDNTAWTIAGDDYNAPDTIYQLPDGSAVAGDKIASSIGWDRVPHGTVVLLNQEQDEREQEPNQQALQALKPAAEPALKPTRPASGPVKLISRGRNAWELAGADYRKKTTIYFYPNGRIMNGNRIRDWDDIPRGTKVLIGYSGPLRLRGGKLKGGLPDDAVLLLPGNRLVTANNAKNAGRLPKSARVFVPAKGVGG
ncbi:MAG: N-acetylmuramoyl-L-alanine amidase [Nitrospirae bacterium]|nr:N-acetylmuramoyl-L-alanine amidase [Nitrospirota bacterium]